MDLGIKLCLVGIVVSFVSFVFAAVNVYRGVSTVFNGDGSSFFAMFKRHIGAIIGIGVGGLFVAVGLVLVIASKL